MLKIRLRRTGAKKAPSYRVVVADSRSPRDGRFIETLGYYNPLTKPATVVIKSDRALHWLNNGAQASDTCARLLTNAGVEHARLTEQLAILRAKGQPKTGAVPVEAVPVAASAAAPAAPAPAAHITATAPTAAAPVAEAAPAAAAPVAEAAVVEAEVPAAEAVPTTEDVPVAEALAAEAAPAAAEAATAETGA